MKKALFILFWLSIFGSGALSAQAVNKFSIIPQPMILEELSGEFNINSKTKIYIRSDSAELELLSDMLADQLEYYTNSRISVSEAKSPRAENIINLSIQPNDTLGSEGYILSVRPDQIILKAADGQGIFYGIQTILQLLPATVHKLATGADVSIPSIDIYDKPHFPWRGMMLDVGRYFYPVSFIKRFIDYLAMHKMNVFHWHLTEDHGWRIEIKKYPKLTEVSAWRKGTQITPGGYVDNRLHGGYYTQDQIREIVAYAKERYITVVPEIEMPGHSLAALVAYPELSCTGGPFQMPVRWGIQKDIYCPKEKTFTFLEDVLTEVMELFPSEYIHIGGDEAPKTTWENSELAQQVIQREGLTDEHELQSYFIRRIEKFLNSHGRQIIGWDEILEGGLAPNASVMSWRGEQGGIIAAKQHHNVVMSPTSHMYFDYYQGDPSLEPVAIPHGITTLQEVYSYEPTPAELSPEEAKYIMGVQGNIWSEFIHSPAKVEYMAFPRAAALAEVAWTHPRVKKWKNFKRKMETQYKRYDAMGINYGKSAYNVQQEVTVDSTARKATISFHTDSYNPQIYYTLDGSAPTPESIRYNHPFEVSEPMIIKAATFKNNKQLSKTSVRYINKSMLQINNILED